MDANMKKLDKKQLQMIPNVRDEWIKIGLSTGDCDREKVNGLIDEVYKVAGLEPPKIKVWLRSPLEGCIGLYILFQTKVVDQVVDKVVDKVWDQVRDQLWDKVGDKVWDQIRDQLRAKVGDQVAQVRDQVGAQVRDQVRVLQVGAQIYKCGYGLHDANWLAFYDFFSLCDIDVSKLKPLMEISKYIGWWWPFENMVIFTDRPIYISMDDDHRLHNEERKAIEYSDGFGIYSWHGVMVPRHIIEEPDKLTTDMVLKEENQEVRRVMLERYGYERLLRELEAVEECIDSFGTLLSTTRLGEYLDGEDDVAKFVLVNDSSTDRRYVLRVDPRSSTAHDGVASTFGRTADQYNPIQEA